MLTEQQIQALIQEVEQLREEKAELVSENQSLQNTILWLRKKIFGKISEKHLPVDPFQLLLFETEQMGAAEKRNWMQP